MSIEHLLKSCRELGEELWEAAGLPESAVKAFFHGNADLTVCDGFAQTSKHNFCRKRRPNDDPLTAWVEREDADGAVQITWENQSRSGTDTDTDTDDAALIRL